MGRDINIGTSGWSYKHWKGLYYPKGLPARKWLSYYAESFRASEINGSFYRLPSQETVLKWMEAVPPDFVFCPKISRYLTHMKKLKDPEEPLDRFFGIFEPMRKMMGPVLIQLPPVLQFNYNTVEHFFGLLQKEYRQYEFVVEVRHDSWMEVDSLSLMTKYDIGFVISQSCNEFPYAELVTSKNIYLRFHGPEELYASSYPDEMLENYAGKCKSWVEQGHVVWAFFNNDIHGYAVEDARRLEKIIKNKEQ